MRGFELAAIAIVLFAAPLVSAQGEDGADENATWGLCTAEDASQPGDDASNGSVSATPPFSNTSEEDCENAEAPWAGTPGEDHVPENPGPPEDPGAPEDPGEEPPEDPGGDQSPGDPDDDNGEDEGHPDDGENPGDDQGGDNRP